MAFTAEQIARAFAQSGGLVPSAGFNGSSVYDGIIAPSGNNAALAEIERSLANAPAQRWAVDANGQRIDPIGYVPTGGVATATMPPTPRARPANAPTRLDMAAINGAGQPVTRVTGQMQPESGGGGLLELLMGKSKNGLPGLWGLLGGPQQGGLLQMLLRGNGGAAPRVAAPAIAKPTLTGTARVASNLGLDPGSVAAMEAWHGGGSSNPQSGGPAGTREYATGGR